LAQKPAQDSPDSAETRQRLSEAVCGALAAKARYVPIGDRAGIGLGK
jgi:hypothetical protein